MLGRLFGELCVTSLGFPRKDPFRKRRNHVPGRTPCVLGYSMNPPSLQPRRGYLRKHAPRQHAAWPHPRPAASEPPTRCLPGLPGRTQTGLPALWMVPPQIHNHASSLALLPSVCFKAGPFFFLFFFFLVSFSVLSNWRHLLLEAGKINTLSTLLRGFPFCWKMD